MSPRALVFAGCLLVAGLARGARAEEPMVGSSQEPTDDELIAEGVSLRKAGKDAEALAVFERALSRRFSARALAQVALAHQALGHWVEAELGLGRALVRADDPWIGRERGYLEQGLAQVRAHLGSLDVASNIEGAEVWIDGERAGRLPLDQPVRVAAGTVAVEVRAPGYPVARRDIDVAPEATAHAWFSLVASPPASEHAPKGPRTAGLVVLGASGVLLLAGVAGLVTREWEAEIYDDDSRCGPTPTQTRSERCGGYRDIGSTAETVGIVALVGSGVGLAVSGWLLLGGSPPSTPAGPVTGCRVTGLGLGCGGSF